MTCRSLATPGPFISTLDGQNYMVQNFTTALQQNHGATVVLLEHLVHGCLNPGVLHACEPRLLCARQRGTDEGL